MQRRALSRTSASPSFFLEARNTMPSTAAVARDRAKARVAALDPDWRDFGEAMAGQGEHRLGRAAP